MLNSAYIRRIIEEGLVEDSHYMDLTTDNLVDPELMGRARLIAKEAGIICGMEIFKEVFHYLDSRIQVANHVRDGEKIQPGMILAELTGPVSPILKGERLALNFLQRMSGIATLSSFYAKAVEGTEVRITDTRKTTPGLRALEKYAVRTGGCFNHRYNLSDGVLIKDNHILAAGGITTALKNIRKTAPHTCKIEIEVETLTQLEEAINAGADIVMLDNMILEDIENACRINQGRVILEASGGIGLEMIPRLAATGISVISVGALTHSPKALDISLKVIPAI